MNIFNCINMFECTRECVCASDSHNNALGGDVRTRREATALATTDKTLVLGSSAQQYKNENSTKK